VLKVNASARIGNTFDISFADGSLFQILATDTYSSKIVALLATAMQLHSVREESEIGLSQTFKIIVSSFGSSMAELKGLPCKLISEDKSGTSCALPVSEDRQIVALQLISLSEIISGHARKKGGALMHGALAEYSNQAIMMAGKGGVGKTTASMRLQPPWRSLSDDATLVVLDDEGKYWAHPWPTWSSFFMPGGSGGIWDTQRGRPLEGILFLSQDEKDGIEPVGKGESAILLQQSSDNFIQPVNQVLNKEKMRALYLQAFDNICRLVRHVPCYKLQVSLNGAFWEKIEQTIFVHQGMKDGKGNSFANFSLE